MTSSGMAESWLEQKFIAHVQVHETPGVGGENLAKVDTIQEQLHSLTEEGKLNAIMMYFSGASNKCDTDTKCGGEKRLSVGHSKLC